MRFTVSEAELCPENQKNNKIIHDGTVSQCTALLQSLKGSKTPQDGSINKRKIKLFCYQKTTVFLRKMSSTAIFVIRPYKQERSS